MLARLNENIPEISEKELSELMEKVSEGLVPYESGNNILTDDKAPVELLGMKVIDDLIQDELEYYKKQFKENGIAGIIG